MAEIEVKAKTSVWTTPVKLAPGGMFKAVGKLFASGAKQDLLGAGGAVLDIAAAAELESDPGAQAGLLVTRALGRALYLLIDPYKMGFVESVVTDERGIAAAIDAELAQTELTIDHRFLEHPRELAILDSFVEHIVRWLEPVDLRGRDPRSIAARLPEHFVDALHQETIDRRGDYDLLFAQFESDFEEAYRRERSWAGYQAWFRRKLAGPVLGDTFSLPDVFIWPRAYYVEEDERQRGRRHEPTVDRSKERRVVGWLRETLDDWMERADPHDVVRVISGDPGAGKSSFARMYAAHRMDRGERVLYVPLHLLDVQGDLGRSLAGLCDEIYAFPRLNLEGDKAEHELLLVLDGLDELSKRGHVGARLADEFVTEVLSKVDKHNYGGLRLRALLSGRPIAVQGIQARVRKPGQLLHLLPFCLVEQELENSQTKWVDADELLARDQRDEWWVRYAAATGASYEGLPEGLQGEELTETTRQPLLGYLLALVYEGAQREGKTIERDISRNEIYSELIDRVYKREWGSRQGHPVLGKMSRSDFRELLEDMALAAWHDGERVTTIAAVERLQGGPQNVERLRAYAEDCDDVSQLFTAFYMRKRGERHSGEETFEFTHKSFAEYLTASRLIAQVDMAARDHEARGTTSGGRYRRQNIREIPEILVAWLEICGPTAISYDLLPYLRREVALRDAEEPGLARRWQSALIELIEYVLREGSPCERLERLLRFIEARAWARNAEEALLAMLSCCSEVTGKVSEIAWPEPTSFGNWLRLLRDQPNNLYQYRTIVGKCLSYLDLQRVSLVAVDLSYADLRGTNLEGADIRYANVSCANMSYAKLTRTNAGYARLNHTNLNFATLNHAILKSTNLSSASLKSANLSSANLSYAKLGHTDLSYADLHSTDLTFANMSYATLRSAKLDYATTDYTNLSNADLRRAIVTAQRLAKTTGTPKHLPDD